MKNQDLFLVETKRIVKIFLKNKHRKSIPLRLKSVAHLLDEDVLSKLSNGKTISNGDEKILSKLFFSALLKEFLAELKKEEPYVFDLIKDSPVVGSRLVKARTSERYELIFENGVKVKCDEFLNKYSCNFTGQVYLNY